MKILLVEDEKYIVKPIKQLLKECNYHVDVAFDGETGLDLGLTGYYDAVILDIMLPKLTGLGVLQTLRENGIKTPVLMLTAKGQVKDKIKGLDSGADDYLAKPFDNDELLARLRALLRRSGDIHYNGILNFGDIELNSEQLLIRCKENTTTLTSKETQLLELFMRRKNLVVPKDMIIGKLWGGESEATYSLVEYHISLLRKKLKQAKSNVYIHTLRGIGYILRVESNEE